MHPTRSIDGYMRSKNMASQEAIAAVKARRERLGVSQSRPAPTRVPPRPQAAPVEDFEPSPAPTKARYALPADAALRERCDAAMRKIMAVNRKGDCLGSPGNEHQLYLGLALRSLHPRMRVLKRADLCGVKFEDAMFFDQLLDIASNASWVLSYVLTEVIEALKE